MIVPEICGHSRTKYARRVHGRAGERSSKENVEGDCRSNDQTGDATRPAFITSPMSW